jgi:hypothetical protein
MKQLPQGKQYPYAQIEQIRLCKVKPGLKMMKRLHDLGKLTRDITDEWIKEFTKGNDNLWQLFMPRLGNKTLHSILREKKVPTFRISYYETNKSMDNKEFLTVKQLKNILHHFSVLLTLFIELNGKSFYHNDLKSNNIMCDVDKKGYISKMWVIDFDIAVDFNQRDRKKSRNDWEYSLKHIDVRYLMSRLVREVLLVACSNKPLCDELLPYIQKIDLFMIESSERNINQDAILLLDEIKAKVRTLREPARNEYVNVVVAPPKIPAKVQKMNAVSRHEINAMGNEDVWSTHK